MITLFFAKVYKDLKDNGLLIFYLFLLFGFATLLMGSLFPDEGLKSRPGSESAESQPLGCLGAQASQITATTISINTVSFYRCFTPKIKRIYFKILMCSLFFRVSNFQ